ncbi:MAG: SUMF1/EgtB/PvdO family nonheme iron enzyme, partial [Planctomycetota bacterium]|nr:SUMF1/EgtB/PvdO family nonheme iron enzyme [Planctomycetota bacterium]
MDEDLRRSDRAHRIRPRDSASILRFFQSQAHVHGERAYLALLNDRHDWNSTPQLLQDRVIALVAEQLEDDFSFLETREWSCASHRHRLGSFIHNESSMIFQLIPGGSFQMGTEAGFSSEAPLHTVTMRQPFLLGRYPVLYREWIR